MFSKLFAKKKTMSDPGVIDTTNSIQNIQSEIPANYKPIIYYSTDKKKYITTYVPEKIQVLTNDCRLKNHHSSLNNQADWLNDTDYLTIEKDEYYEDINDIINFYNENNENDKNYNDNNYKDDNVYSDTFKISDSFSTDSSLDSEYYKQVDLSYNLNKLKKQGDDYVSKHYNDYISKNYKYNSNEGVYYLNNRESLYSNTSHYLDSN
jgi:hypothetical protein